MIDKCDEFAEDELKDNPSVDEEPEERDENDQKTADENSSGDGDLLDKEEVKILKNDKKKLEDKLKEANDKVLRISAETDNYKKRLAKESDDKVRYANQGLVTELLNVVDHLEMALNHSDENSNVEALKKGVEITLKQFKETLKKYGVEEIEVKEGDVFDPKVHEAMMLDERDDLDNNRISAVMQKGYKMHNRVVRSTKVRVNKKEKKQDKQEENNE